MGSAGRRARRTDPAEGDEARRERLGRILSGLHALHGDADCALDHRSALELLVATILSAQCTDERVNRVTPALFRRYPDAAAYADADAAELEELIRSTGFFRNKARSIRALGQVLIERHGGEVPDRMDDLVELPGVGRKTANVVLGVWFREPAIPVDTHVTRLVGRLGLTDETDPVRIEYALQDLAPREEWTFLSHGLIWHGRTICPARAPRCERCPLAADCPFPARDSA